MEADLLYYFDNYGWLFLFMFICIVLIGAASFLDFGLVERSKCSFERGFACSLPELKDGKITFTLQNLHASSITVVSVQFDGNVCNQLAEMNLKLDVGVGKPISLPCAARKIKGDLRITYVSQYSGLKEMGIGALSASASKA